MAPKHSCFFLLLLALIAVNVSAETPQISYPPVPPWVHQVEWVPSTNRPPEAKSESTRCLLFERQERPRNAEAFVRVILLMENEAGVQDSGSLRFSFNPAFQELCLHRVEIHRGGKTIDRLNRSKVRLIQPEPGLSEHMFTGRQTAVLFVEDLRVGDALEYAYSIRGANPILGGHYSSRFIVQSDVPVERQRFRVLWQYPAPLHRRLHLTDAEPVIHESSDGTEYVWDATNLAAIPYEDWRPVDYEPYPEVELSDFADWGSVVNWALPLYSVNTTNLPADLRDLIARWEHSAASDEEKARFALQFVQDELRYTGIELGPDSYRPSDPVETYQRRFGDCKGKVALLRLLLQRMNLKAYPALVSSDMQGAVADHLPSPFAFNHVILLIELHGKAVWVDPTMAHQGGSLGNHYLPPYGKALVIRPGNHALEDVPRSRPESASRRKATSTFTIRDYDSPVAYSVLTEYRGASADGMREEMAGKSREAVAKEYLNYYARTYPGITATQPLKVSDNRLTNVVTVEEFYSITNFWVYDAEDRLWKARFYAENLYNLLTEPDTRLRKSPLALNYPAQRQHETIVHLPDSGWQIPALQTNVENEAFSFSYHRQLSGSTVTFNYECHTRLPALPAALVPGYLAKRQQMEDLLVDILQRSDGKVAHGVNWLMVVIAVFGVGFTTAIAIWYGRRVTVNSDAALPPPLPQDARLQGLGGWLILVAIGLCLAPLVRIVTLSQNWEGYFSAHVWQTCALPQGASYHPLFGPMLIFELLGNIVLLGLNLLAACLFFAKRKAFPRLFILFILCLAAFLILDDVGCALIPSLQSTAAATDHTDATRATIYAMIWSLYMLKSRRVKATFIR